MKNAVLLQCHCTVCTFTEFLFHLWFFCVSSLDSCQSGCHWNSCQLTSMCRWIVSHCHITVHGGWSKWKEWGECTLPCNGGQRKRFRACDSPTPSLGGRACTGVNQETGECNSQPCPGLYSLLLLFNFYCLPWCVSYTKDYCVDS